MESGLNSVSSRRISIVGVSSMGTSPLSRRFWLCSAFFLIADTMLEISQMMPMTTQKITLIRASSPAARMVGWKCIEVQI